MRYLIIGIVLFAVAWLCPAVASADNCLEATNNEIATIDLKVLALKDQERSDVPRRLDTGRVGRIVSDADLDVLLRTNGLISEMHIQAPIGCPVPVPFVLERHSGSTLNMNFTVAPTFEGAERERIKGTGYFVAVRLIELSLVSFGETSIELPQVYTLAFAQKDEMGGRQYLVIHLSSTLIVVALEERQPLSSVSRPWSSGMTTSHKVASWIICSMCNGDGHRDLVFRQAWSKPVTVSMIDANNFG